MAEKKIKNKKDKKEVKAEPQSRYASVLLKPRVTEKASFLQQGNVYTFEVAINATKSEVLKAVKDIYKVTPVRINIVKNPAKKIFFKGKRGVISGVKKAYVSLKKGDTIKT